MINLHTDEYVKSHQEALRRDAAEHRPRRDVRRRGSPGATGVRTALARLFVGAGARLAPTGAGFVVADRAVVLPASKPTPSRRTTSKAAA
jgi:hypothetical protein